MVKMRKGKLKMKNVILFVLALVITIGSVVSYGIYRTVAK